MGNHQSFLRRSTYSAERTAVEYAKHRGPHEYQVLGSGPESSESEMAWKECTKNPRHRSYIPVNKFNKSHLPEEIHEEHLVQSIRDNVCDLTVRLRVNHTSTRRYDFKKMNNGTRTGTGYISAVFKFQENGKYDVEGYSFSRNKISSAQSFACPCPECYLTAKPTKLKWVIQVVTAAHVVFDDEEASFTLVDLFYDDLADAEQDGRMRTLWGMKVLEVSIKEDKCYFLCAIHDENLALRLQSCVKQSVESHKINAQKQPSCSHVVIASHPHGRPKMLTFGKFTIDTVKRRKYSRKQLMYEADTCPGSSGALIFALNSSGVINTTYVHSQGDMKLRLNKSNFYNGTYGYGALLCRCPARKTLLTSAAMVGCCNIRLK